MAWYRKYVDVLQNLGWIVGEMEFKEQTVSETNAGVHRAIIPVIMSMMVPGSAALTMVLSVLNGLKDTDSSGNPRISAMCFGILPTMP
ncbi:hypothetical protein QTI24_29735 [Variovorax sp. J22P240]|uniref:hypothetical protein n=1 Tax=Variovorax sp. J22P240 TaxID=3053514 RepID=UPI00257911BA|nr:hypothetical protein [Variovorax sp. J22P240]MDM0002805.1 hypothetical protein [Variovorax sp. J22P240]